MSDNAHCVAFERAPVAVVRVVTGPPGNPLPAASVAPRTHRDSRMRVRVVRVGGVKPVRIPQRFSATRISVKPWQILRWFSAARPGRAESADLTPTPPVIEKPEPKASQRIEKPSPVHAARQAAGHEGLETTCCLPAGCVKTFGPTRKNRARIIHGFIQGQTPTGSRRRTPTRGGGSRSR